MDNEDLGKLSTEQLQNFDKILSEIKLLPKRYDELIEKALAGEAKIATKRAEQLDAYFDEYSKRLDKIIRKSYTLYESLSTAGKSFTEGFIPTDTPGESASSGKKSASADDKSHDTSTSSGTADSDAVKELTDAVKNLKGVVNADKRGKLGEVSTLSIQDLQMSAEKAVSKAEQTLSNLKYDLSIEQAFAKTPEAGELRAREVNAQNEQKAIKKQAELQAKWIADEELKAQRKNNGILSKEEAARIQKEAADKFKYDKESLEKLNKLSQAQEERNRRDKEKAEKKARQEKGEALLGTLTGAGVSLTDRIDAFKDLTTNDETGKTDMKAVAAVMTNAVSDLAKKLEATVDTIALHKGTIDTRLQGSKNDTHMGSYWDQLVKDMTSVGAVTPYFKQEDFAKNIESLVDRGIAFDLKQRAFLMTIQGKIANTFEAADGTLLRLIRLQQEDSTAGRLGMESALNSFLNEMYENTEYLKDVAANVRGSLQEMEALMTGAAATEVEYQVQKWMGSLYSVGMSQEAVQNIAGTLGQIAAGQIEGLTSGSGTNNLLVMAANSAGLSIADILAEGLDANATNKLLQATVNYLAEIAESSKGNNVVQQQLANVFGVKASDLRAATNLATPGTLSSISGSNLTYKNLLGQLFNMAGSMWQRTSVGEMMSNVWANGQYTLAGSMASNPLSYLTYKAATLLDNMAGGIAIPGISVMGNMVDLETTVADLMRVGAMSSGILGSLGSIISGLGSSFSGRSMLNTLGITSDGQLAINQRGTGSIGALEGGAQQTLSSSGYVGNAKGSDIKDSTMQAAEDDKKRQMIKAKEEEPSNQVDMINTSVLKIYEILDEVTKGSKTLRVRVDNYGLTGENARVAQGGTASLLGSSDASGSLGENPSSSGNQSAGVTGSMVDLGGWTMM